MIREARTIWRRAHPVRLPCRNTTVHDELRAARLRDLIRLKQIEDELARAIEPMLDEAFANAS